MQPWQSMPATQSRTVAAGPPPVTVTGTASRAGQAAGLPRPGPAAAAASGPWLSRLLPRRPA